MHRPIFQIFTLFLLSFGVFAADFQVETTPVKAEVFLEGAGAGKVKLGETPLKMPIKEVFRHVGSDKTFRIKIKKKGFDDYNIMLVKSENADFKLEVLLEVNKEIKTIREHDVLMGELFKVQRLIRSNNFSDALGRLDDLEKKHSDFSIITELKGIAYYMQKDVTKALSMFRSAFSKNSNNRDAYKMKVYLEKRLGLDAEAR